MLLECLLADAADAAVVADVDVVVGRAGVGCWCSPSLTCGGYTSYAAVTNKEFLCSPPHATAHHAGLKPSCQQSQRQRKQVASPEIDFTATIRSSSRAQTTVSRKVLDSDGQESQGLNIQLQPHGAPSSRSRVVERKSGGPADTQARKSIRSHRNNASTRTCWGADLFSPQAAWGDIQGAHKLPVDARPHARS